MKRFSDLQDINTDIVLNIKLRPILENGPPHIEVVLSHTTLFEGALEQPITLVRKLSVINPITLSIILSDKKYDEHRETAVVIEQIEVDGIQLIPNFTQHAQYVNDHKYTDPTSYLGFNGSWTFKTEVPFYRWHHAVTGQGLLLFT